MRTITIEIRNEIALKFLYNLESMQIIRFINKDIKPHKKKLSERFVGCISEDRANELHNELKKMRKEWERDI